MRYLYDGFISERMAENIEDMAKSYGYVVEISQWPQNWYEWQKANLKDYPHVTEDCMGQSYTEQRKHYGFVQEDFNQRPMFLFLKSQEEKNYFIRDFPKLVVNESPFKTVV